MKITFLILVMSFIAIPQFGFSYGDCEEDLREFLWKTKNHIKFLQKFGPKIVDPTWRPTCPDRDKFKTLVRSSIRVMELKTCAFAPALDVESPDFTEALKQQLAVWKAWRPATGESSPRCQDYALANIWTDLVPEETRGQWREPLKDDLAFLGNLATDQSEFDVDKMRKAITNINEEVGISVGGIQRVQGAWGISSDRAIWLTYLCASGYFCPDFEERIERNSLGNRK